MLGNKDVQTRSQAVDAIARIGRPAVTELVAALRDPDHQRRQNAARVLGRIGPSAKDAAGDLAASLDDKEPPVRIAAAALIRVDPERARPALDVLIAVLREKSETAYLNQMVVIRELGELGPVAQPAMPALNSLVWPGFGDPLELAAVAALRKIDPRPATPARDPWDDIIGDKPPQPGAVTVPNPVADGTLVPWQDILRVVGDKAEVGKRAGQRFVLLTGRVLVVEGTNAFDLFFSPTRDGIEAGAAVMSSTLFTLEEKQALLALGGRKEAERVAGRFRMRVGSTAGANSDLPGHWIRIEFEQADKGGKTVAHAVVLAGNYTADELYTRSKHRELNKLVRSHVELKYPAKELTLRVRILNNLADAAGYTSPEALAAVERAIQDAKRNGIESSFDIDAAEKAFAFVVATNKEALDGRARTNRGAEPTTPKEPEAKSPEPIDPKVVAAWEKAGAELQWLRVDPRDGTLTTYPSKTPRTGDLPAFVLTKAISPAALSRLPRPSAPFALDLSYAKGEDELVKELGAFEELQALCFSGGFSDLTDAGVLHLPRLKGLRSLDLGNTPITGKTLDVLTKLEKLTSLSLRDIKINDDTVGEIAGCKKLVTLSLAGTRVTDAGLKELVRLVQLRVLSLERTKVTDEGLKLLAKCRELRSLNLRLTGGTGAGLRSLAELGRLELLDVSSCDVSDADLEAFPRLTELRSLHLEGTKITDEGLKSVGKLKHLNTLALRGRLITDAGMKHLTGLTELKALQLPGTDVTDEGLKDLVKLSELQVLVASGTKITDRGLEDVAKLKHLEELVLNDLKVTDDGLKSVSNLKQLRSLDLRETRVTDEGLKELWGLKQLRAVDLHNSRVTPAGVAELKKALPNASVTR